MNSLAFFFIGCVAMLLFDIVVPSPLLTRMFALSNFYVDVLMEVKNN